MRAVDEIPESRFQGQPKRNLWYTFAAVTAHHSGGPKGLGLELGLGMDEPQCITILLRNGGPPGMADPNLLLQGRCVGCEIQRIYPAKFLLRRFCTA